MNKMNSLNNILSPCSWFSFLFFVVFTQSLFLVPKLKSKPKYSEILNHKKPDIIAVDKLNHPRERKHWRWSLGISSKLEDLKIYYFREKTIKFHEHPCCGFYSTFLEIEYLIGRKSHFRSVARLRCSPNRIPH